MIIDGKKLRGTAPKLNGTKGDYLMNAYVGENHIMIGQLRLKDKENEITAIPQIIEKLDIDGAVVSIDAIGTQVNIAQDILDKKAHYFLAVKENQGAMNQQIVDAFRYNKPLDTATQMDAEHGRIETRDCRILDVSVIEDTEVSGRWPGLKTLVEITSMVDYGDHTTKNVRLYISDEDFPKAAYFNMLARGHWSIENQLHWNLDVTFKEDVSRARKDYAAQNLSAIRKLALQVVKGHNDKRRRKGDSGCHCLRTIFWSCCCLLIFDAVALGAGRRRKPDYGTEEVAMTPLAEMPWASTDIFRQV